MNNIRALVSLAAVDLPVGQNIRIICPLCNGGTTNERSMSITRTTSGILYYCYRATCFDKGKQGFIGDITAPTEDNVGRSSKNRTFKGVLNQLPESVYKERFEIYQISYETCTEQGIKFAPEINRIYFPIFDIKGVQIGENLKSLPGTKGPKAIINYYSNVLRLPSFPIQPKLGSILCLVEDAISAIKVSSIVSSAALLGSHLTTEGFHLLLKHFKQIDIFLDGDATYKAIELYKTVSQFVKSRLHIIPNGKDPKDLTYEQLKELLA